MDLKKIKEWFDGFKEDKYQFFGYFREGKYIWGITSYMAIRINISTSQIKDVFKHIPHIKNFKFFYTFDSVKDCLDINHKVVFKTFEELEIDKLKMQQIRESDIESEIKLTSDKDTYELRKFVFLKFAEIGEIKLAERAIKVTGSPFPLILFTLNKKCIGFLTTLTPKEDEVE